jgi:hypothetical protein
MNLVMRCNQENWGAIHPEAQLDSHRGVEYSCVIMSAIVQKIRYESGCVMVEASGEFSLNEAQRAFLEMLASVVQYRAHKVLLDGRKLQGRPKDMERFFYGEFAAKETLKLVKEHNIIPRFAYVIHEPVLDRTRLGETVAVNRGMNVKVFETLEEATLWLDLP